MTTIAYRNGVLAVDGQATRSNIIVELDARKWHKCKDGTIIAFTGDLQKFHPFIDWVENGRDHANKPNMAFGDDESCQGIVVTEHAVYEYDKDGFSIIHDEFAAWGSGAPFALTAMVLGYGAVDAVKVASKLDIYTGGTIKGVSYGNSSSEG